MDAHSVVYYSGAMAPPRLRGVVSSWERTLSVIFLSTEPLGVYSLAPLNPKKGECSPNRKDYLGMKVLTFPDPTLLIRRVSVHSI